MVELSFICIKTTGENLVIWLARNVRNVVITFDSLKFWVLLVVNAVGIFYDKISFIWLILLLYNVFLIVEKTSQLLLLDAKNEREWNIMKLCMCLLQHNRLALKLLWLLLC